MRLSEFILSNLESIAKEWEAFARTLSPSRSLTSRAVRNDLERMLRFIAADIESAQTGAQQREKAAGRGPTLQGGRLSAAHEHGLQRLAQSFTLVETISEFRALRASVTRLWLAERDSPDDAQELIRFNEAMDQIVAESVLQFTGKLDRDRELLLGMVTHDLRNPLSVITSSGELLRRVPDSNASAEVADRIVHAAHRMESIINDLLDFTRTRLGSQLPVTPSRCDLADIARGTAKELSADGRISVIARSDCTGYWDRGRITQLVANLLGNAQQHGDKNAPIAVEIAGDSDHVHMWVRNSGPSIPADEKEAIFQPMLRGASARKTRGHTTSLGLGLFIVQQIARAHGGTVALASSDERETVFHVELPREFKAASPPHANPSAVPSGRNTADC